MAEIETPALTAWYEHRDLGEFDRPEVEVRFMRRAPYERVCGACRRPLIAGQLVRLASKGIVHHDCAPENGDATDA